MSKQIFLFRDTRYGVIYNLNKIWDNKERSKFLGYIPT